MKNNFKIVSAMLIFGSIGIFVRNIDLASLEIAFLRATIGSIFIGIFGLLIKQKNSLQLIKENIVLLVISGIAMGLNWIFLFQAYKYTTISNATLSYYFAPVFVIVLSPIFLKEKLNKRKVICVIGAMVGLFIVLNGDSSGLDSSYNHIKGIVYGLLGAGLYASIILMNKFIKNLSGFETTLIQLTVSAFVLLPVILYQGNLNIVNITNKSWIFIILLGVVHTGIAYLLYFSSMKELKGQSIAILSYIDPISAVVFSSIFLGENMNLFKVVGGIFILGSTLLSEKQNLNSNNENIENEPMGVQDI
jgi:RarD protein